MVEIVRHADLLACLGLTTLAGARAFQGQLVKDHKGRRDIFRIPAVTAFDQGQSPVLFLKRNWHPYKKDGLASLFRRGAVWSAARQEWENASLLAVTDGEVTEYLLPSGVVAARYPKELVAVGFSRDGRSVIGQIGDDVLRWPDRSAPAVMARARRAVYRSLTEAERVRFEMHRPVV